MKSFLMSVVTAICLLPTPHAASDEATPQATAEQRVIPLAEIVTTSPQKGMLHREDIFPRTGDGRQDAIRRVFWQKLVSDVNCGASNVFLVDAANPPDAVRATTSIMLGSRAARTPAPVNVPEPARGNYWLVAFLGAGPSTPTWWAVDSIVLRGRKMTLTYRESPPIGATRDVNPYYYWVPIGALNAGIYELELYDAGREMVKLLRRVEVEGAK